jgi:NADH:ubiquinone reductase (H+-translocating)
MEKKRIVILGGGFAGLYAALEFEKSLARDAGVEITLVNRENFFLFTPMLHEVAASDLDITHIVNPIRKLVKRVRFFNGTVETIDVTGKSVTVAHAEGRHQHTLSYDHLVIGLGSITNFFNLPGLAERALTMKSLGDAIELRNRLIQLLEEADFECASGKREYLLSIVVAGGGFAGVETVAGVNDFLREALRFYPHLTEGHLRVMLVEPGPLLLPELGEKLGAYAQEKLAERKVEIRVKTGVQGITERGVVLSDGTTIPAHTLVWTAGTSPNPLLASLPCRKERGRICVDEFMQVPGYPGVWALGDCAAVPDGQTGKLYPPTAQHALRQGKVLAQNIAAAIRGGGKRPFVFSTIGQLAAIGRRTGVARIFGFNFSGFVAWWLWRSIYLGKLPRFEKKMRVMLDWTLDILFSKDLVQFTTTREQRVSRPEETTAAARREAAGSGSR